MSRYVETPSSVLEIVKQVREEHFPQLENCNIKVLMDSKKKMSGGKIVFAYVKKANQVEKFLTADEIVNNGVDIFMFIDSNIFYNISEGDKVRLIRHELRHIFYDPESTESPYKIIDHDVTDFRVEIELNQDEPMWGERVSEIAAAVYAKD